MAAHGVSRSFGERSAALEGRGSGRIEADGATPDTPLISALLSISKSTRALAGLKLAELGFYNGQDELLIALHESELVPVSKLAETLNVRPSTVFKMMDRLVEKDTVQREHDAHDARKTLARITPAGLDCRNRLLKMRQDLDRELVANCANAEATIEILENTAAALRKRLLRFR